MAFYFNEKILEKLLKSAVWFDLELYYFSNVSEPTSDCTIPLRANKTSNKIFTLKK